MAGWRTLSRAFYLRDAETVARDLLGRLLVRVLEGERLALRIVETEAYLGARDRASHAWGGRRSRRNASLYEAGGCAYVYLIYGLHHCLNAVVGEAGEGGAVLIRAGEPVAGAERMRALRGLRREPRPGDLAGGPGKLAQALAVDLSLDGASLLSGPLRIARGAALPRERVAAGPRVGIDYAGAAAAWPLRFADRESRHVSRPRPAG